MEPLKFDQIPTLVTISADFEKTCQKLISKYLQKLEIKFQKALKQYREHSQPQANNNV